MLLPGLYRQHSTSHRLPIVEQRFRAPPCICRALKFKKLFDDPAPSGSLEIRHACPHQSRKCAKSSQYQKNVLTCPYTIVAVQRTELNLLGSSAHQPLLPDVTEAPSKLQPTQRDGSSCTGSVTCKISPVSMNPTVRSLTSPA